MITDKEFAQWIKERNAAVLSLDIKKFKEFYMKWYKKGLYEMELPADNVIEVSMRQMICAMSNAPLQAKADARQWLKERGFKTWE